jgi:hypothetical protein
MLEAKQKEENKDLRNPIQARHFIKESIYSEYKPLDWFSGKI